jgi:EpsI family protein
MSRARVLIVVLLLAAAGVIARGAVGVPLTPPRLSALPYAFETWRGAEAPPLDEETLRILAADDVLNRTYAGADRTPIGLYVADYAVQRPGVSIHSPLHCLPGTGWEALSVDTVGLSAPGFPGGTMRRMVVGRGRQRALVLYWYALHGRIIASEITTKVTQLADSVRLHRSDAAMVRIVVPIGRSVAAADERGLAFARDLAPRMRDLLR